jgi:predicted RNA-binding Zn-ribbon protein involved in translation (DUF1610 family)
MEKFICIAHCPELDDKNLRHCTDTKEAIRKREEEFQDYCPCGNQEIWQKIESEEKAVTTSEVTDTTDKHCKDCNWYESCYNSNERYNEEVYHEPVTKSCEDYIDDTDFQLNI